MKKHIILFVFVMAVVLKLEASPSVGTVQGKVSEDPGSRVIPGVLVTIMDTGFHTLSNEKGEYKFISVPAGNYRIKFSATGFGTIVETDVIVRPDRITFLDVKMKEQLPHVKETVTVEESYFRKNEKVATSTINISAEEIRRTPGTAGFITRT
ncbi:MAG: carboxypeptidase-like regulatory domain-containing protein, partial [bacterium]